MTNSLDSRFLGIGNCIAVKFTEAGTLRHVLTPGSHVGGKVAAHEGYPIEVKAKADAAPAKQFNVKVKRSGAGLVPDVDQLSIQVGDSVLWCTTDPSASGFAVWISGEKLSFSSHKLRGEAIYTHAFGVPGTYDWADAENPNLAGTVEVRAVTPKTDAEKQAWLDSLSKGAAFEIRGGKVSPQKLEIVVGQTVFWKVWDGDGMCIVDKRLLAAPHKMRK